MVRELITLIFMALLLSSCLPEQGARQLSGTTDNLDGGSISDGEETIGNGETSAPYWYDGGNSLTTLTIDFDNKKNHYLFGSLIDQYLSSASNFNGSYCLYTKFATGSNSSFPLMVRATPAITVNYSNGNKTRYWRINLSSELGNDFCNLPAKNGANAPLTNLAALVYHPKNVCAGCRNIIASEEFVLYKHVDSASGGYLQRIEQTEIPYGNLSLRIDLNGNTQDNSGFCTDSSCSAQGYDCCVNGQCVNEGNVKLSGAQSDPDSFALAELEKATDPNWYLKYPEFYYICLEDPQNGTEDPLDPEDPVSDAQERLVKMLADYECVEELKANSLESPFHKDPVDESLPNGSYKTCDVSEPPPEPLPNMHYKKVMQRLYANCGCGQSELSDMVNFCPAYTYKLVYKKDALGNDTDEISDVACVTPQSHDNDLPFQDLEVSVNSRSAPHRFFNEDGKEIDPYDPTNIEGSSTQEGEPFQYLDNERLFPLNGAFNMNSLLGQMTVGLDQARPAKVVELDFDKSYYIAVLQGTYTACPSCSKDSWFTNFSPYPTTQQGLGIRATGFTTSRDSWGTNSSFANYEDAVFGRACWVPPTMLPFGHSAKADAKEQRLARLKTQAAMYVNGYQRDWFGFNRGALIGSFDGVTWFAIGKGRIVKATSDRLFLAINAPFADLANPSDHIVSVQEYDFVTTGAKYDYDPSEEINSAFQNEAGLCQKHHECETDSHCITKLGWEYSCVNVYEYKTHWPSFEPSGAKEVAQDARTGALVQFLQQGELPVGSGSRRCVYRGAGAPCRSDLENISDENARRALACAPNFYCANVTSSDFNKEVARYGASLDSVIDPKNHYYGQDANILGRPKDYIALSGASALPQDVRNTIKENMELTEPGTASVGLCRPGKSLPSYGAGLATNNYDQLKQQQIKDIQNRTDFISQIAGCNSTLFTSLRYSSCPMIGPDGNYLHLSDEYLNEDGLAASDSLGAWGFGNRKDATKYYSTQQNMCGLEAVDSAMYSVYDKTEEELREKSAFKTIEARNLASADVQIEPTLVQNACFRRAGSVCHTNYDCAPNFKHYEVLDLLSPDVFGNTPERKYWEEYLVCAQEKREPILTSSPEPSQLEAYNAYSMHNNRCCREVGKEITIYTEDVSNMPETAGLRTDIYGGFQPNNPKRYSRFAASLPVVNDNSLTAQTPGASRVSAKRPDPSDPTAPSILDRNQWKNIHDAAARTCCGGTWVRKFADGSNDWSRNRLNLDVSNFKCINYKTPLLLAEDPSVYGDGSGLDGMNLGQVSQDSINFCPDTGASAGGCAQWEIDPIDDFTRVRPVLDGTTARMTIDSDPDEMNNGNYWANNPYSFMQLLSYVSNPEGANSDVFEGMPYMDWSKTFSDVDTEEESSQAIFTRIPTFIAFDNIDNLNIKMEQPGGGSPVACTHICPGGAAPDAAGRCPLDETAGYFACDGNLMDWAGICEITNVSWNDPGLGDPCYYLYDSPTRRLKVVYPQSVIDDTNNYETQKISIQIDFTAPGTLRWEQERVAPATPTDDPAALPHRRGSRPGNALYYLEKLAKLEYIGIPQMTYEPIFCNDNYQKLVPGIFKEEYKTAKEFIDSPETFPDTSLPTYWTTSGGGNYNPANHWSTDEMRKVADQALLAQEPVFSAHEFKCCLPLGSEIGETDPASMCCSGARREIDSNSNGSDGVKYMCALPTGTDLNVYFNKFVSGEGLSDEYLTNAQPLTVSDFDSKTGEPKLDGAVINKLIAIGNELCEAGATTRGGAYGAFFPEPYSNYEPEGAAIEPIGSILDSPYDNGTNNNRNTGFNVFQEGYRWNHHIYCSEEGTN